MLIAIEAGGFGIIGYLCGSLAFALWITWLVKGVDVRQAGSGHATATNTMRTAGWGAFVAVLILDLGKGFLPVWLARELASAEWIAGLTAMGAVVGHCWPIFAGFKGGMGLAAAGGSLLAASPLGFTVGLGVLIGFTLILHHSARAAVITGLLLPLIYVGLGWRGSLIWVALGVGLVISMRFSSDWNRQYRELWLDRESR